MGESVQARSRSDSVILEHIIKLNIPFTLLFFP